jgi:esterase/lipase superfamily enzyme
MNSKGIQHKLFVWDTYNSHDWPTWMRMVDQYL